MACWWDKTVNAWVYGLTGAFKFPKEPQAWAELPPAPTPAELGQLL
ncbi:MAG: hypothetical protein HC889_00535 [Synechococcaceae cyanobacterium SM1_2_3]|nr:hypothetical protein [Synechococcaceae cyanobacterium SM1_2_3]